MAKSIDHTRKDFIAWPTPEGWRLGSVSAVEDGRATQAIEFGTRKGAWLTSGAKVCYRRWFRNEEDVAEMIEAYDGPLRTQQDGVDFVLPFTMFRRQG